MSKKKPKTAIDKMNKLRTHSTNAKSQEDVLIVAPAHYRDLRDMGDDYSTTAKLLYKASKNPALKHMIEQSINGEDSRVYGPESNYKSQYNYSNDD